MFCKVGWLGAIPFTYVAVSPQTLSLPAFPIHSLWETLSGTDQVAYDDLYNNHAWVSFKAAPKQYPNAARMESIGSPSCVVCAPIRFSSPTHYCSNVTHPPINYPKCYLLQSIATLDKPTSTYPRRFLPSSAVLVLLILFYHFPHKWRHKVSRLFSVNRQPSDLFLTY